MSVLITLYHFLSDEKCAPVAGAGLGACFYILMKLQPYLENRSFDPKYNSAYLTRFVVGMVAGVILAYVVRAYVTCDDPEHPTGIKCLSPAIIAILGGFSSEAVQEILQRLVDVLLTTVRGDNSAQTQAKLEAQQNAKFAEVREKLDAVTKAKNAHPDEFQKHIDNVKAVLKPKSS